MFRAADPPRGYWNPEFLEAGRRSNAWIFFVKFFAGSWPLYGRGKKGGKGVIGRAKSLMRFIPFSVT